MENAGKSGASMIVWSSCVEEVLLFVFFLFDYHCCVCYYDDTNEKIINNNNTLKFNIKENQQRREKEKVESNKVTII